MKEGRRGNVTQWLMLCLGLLAIASAGCESDPSDPSAVPVRNDSANVAGKWAVTLKPRRGGGLHKITLTMEQVGEELTGTWIPNNRPDMINQVSGKIDRNEVLLTILLPNGNTLRVTGLVEEDLMLGRFKLFEDDPGLELRAERQSQP